MKRLVISLIILMFALSLQAQYRPAGSNYTPSEKTVLWTADSTAPFKVVGKSLQAVEVFDIPGKTKNELYNSVIDYFSNRYGHYLELFKDKDRESGRISVAWNQQNPEHDCTVSRSVIIETKEGKIRITTSLNRLRVNDVADKLFGKTSAITAKEYFADLDIASCYPLVPPQKKRPNYWERYHKKVLTWEIKEAKAVTKELVEYVSKPSEDW